MKGVILNGDNRNYLWDYQILSCMSSISMQWVLNKCLLNEQMDGINS